MKNLFALTLAAALAACAQNPATGGQMFTLVGQGGEREIGQTTANAHLKRYGMYRPASTITTYVQDLCARTWAVTESARDPISCLLLDDWGFNAWATPGYVNINRGLLPYVGSEAELVAVLGHEAGHVTARHVAQKVTTQQVAGLLVTALGIYAASKTDSGPGTQAAMQGASVAAGLGLAAYSRHHEEQADGLGQRYMERLGYDKREAVNMLAAMQAYETYQNQVSAAFNGGKPAPGPGRWTSTHPLTPDRQTKAIQTVGGVPDGSVKLPSGVQPATPAADPQGVVRYLKALDGTTFGPQRKFGVAGKDYIALPKQRFVLQLPQGFIAQYEEHEKADTQGLWTAVHPASGVNVALAVGTYKAGMNAGHALQELFPQTRDLSRITVAGREAYMGNASARSGKVQKLLAVPLPETDTLAIIALEFTSAAQAAAEAAAVLDSMQNSVVLSENGAKQYSPLELKFATIQPGDTLAKLAARLPQGALQVEQLMAMNRWTPDTPLVPGLPYKTLVDTNPR